MTLIQDTIKPTSGLEPAVVRNIRIIRCDTKVKLGFFVADSSPETVSFGLGPMIPQDVEGREPTHGFLL